MPVEIRVHKKFLARVDRARLKRVAQRALNAEKKRGARSVSIYISTDREIRVLNRQFHSTDAATDVLSFPVRVGVKSPLERDNFIGDIVISYDRARVQAREARWRIADELDLLVVHGVLHLVGYTDSTLRARRQMWKRQAKILKKRLRE